MDNFENQSQMSPMSNEEKPMKAKKEKNNDVGIKATLVIVIAALLAIAAVYIIPLVW